jgi:hypothetical protein
MHIQLVCNPGKRQQEKRLENGASLQLISLRLYSPVWSLFCSAGQCNVAEDIEHSHEIYVRYETPTILFCCSFASTDSLACVIFDEQTQIILCVLASTRLDQHLPCLYDGVDDTCTRLKISAVTRCDGRPQPTANSAMDKE